mgnify:CR=1 FL=1
MKRIALLSLLLIAPAVYAEEGSVATAFEQITVSSTSVGLTTSNYDLTNADLSRRTKRVVCSVESNAIRFRVDGTAPTASVGYPVTAGQQIIIDKPNDIENFRSIRQSADATLSCIYWR